LKNITILLITDFFPYSSSEQFLETEVKYYKDCNVTIMPRHYAETYRSLNNKQIEIDNFLINNKLNSINKLFYTIKIFISSYFFKEFFSEKLFNFSKFKSFRASMLSLYHYYYLFDKYFTKQTTLNNLIVYTYWNNEVTYALQILKKKYKYKLISRIHGYDLYKERRIANYMPLKSQFTQNINKIYTITESANKYLYQEYGFCSNKIELSKLGVEDKKIVTQPTQNNTLHIVSCSFLTEVKQVHKIVESLSILGKNHPNIEYKWTHIGNGPLYHQISELAKESLSELTNVQYTLKGELKNQDVYNFYKNNNIDVFINVSKSEGVPVSIMEAMSCYIPIIAPDIGGISDMLTNNINGVLLSHRCSISEIILALKQYKNFKNKDMRTNSYNIFFENYNAKVNYSKFINNLLNIRESNV
jgi:glycosyltransferase involved in cell wall biosynthesis